MAAFVSLAFVITELNVCNEASLFDWIHRHCYGNPDCRSGIPSLPGLSPDPSRFQLNHSMLHTCGRRSKLLTLRRHKNVPATAPSRWRVSRPGDNFANAGSSRGPFTVRRQAIVRSRSLLYAHTMQPYIHTSMALTNRCVNTDRVRS